MSDTVKLIIEIPKEMMKALEVGNFDSKYNPYDVCWQVRNGIPLDSFPVREKGEWIEHDITELKKLGYYRCSKCNKGFKRFDYGERVSVIPMINGTHYALKIVDNFCPNCGADMKGGVKNDRDFYHKAKLRNRKKQFRIYSRPTRTTLG